MNKRARPSIGLSIIVMDDKQRVLMGVRRGAHGAGTLSFPGGHLEWLEQFHYCAKREMEEEVGWGEGKNYEFVDDSPVAVTNDIHFPEGKHYITLFFRAHYLKGKAESVEEHRCDGWKWYEWEKLPEMNLFVPVQNLLKQKYNPFKK